MTRLQPLRFISRVVLLGAALLITYRGATAQVVVTQRQDLPEGRAVYDQACASCHDHPETSKAPALDTLRRTGLRALSYALTDGKMKVQAAALTPKQIDAVVGYLARTAQADTGWIEQHACAATRAKPNTGEATVAGFGLGLRNHRALTAAEAGLGKADLGKLELAWVLGFPQTANMRAQPAIVGSTMYLPIVDSGQVFAIDIGGEPCVQWVYQHGVPLRTHVNYGTLPDGRRVLLFGDGAAHVQMLDAATGQLLWRTSLRVTSVSNTTGMPVLYQGRVYAPISSGELNMGAAPDYQCCTSHGAVAALDATTGARIWLYHTMEAATPRKLSRIGTQQWGPSGAPIWTTPAIDEKRGVLYVGTGQNTSEPATDSSDAVLALDLETGALRWKHQTTPNDIFLTGCMADPAGPNCPPESSINKDWDFGASMVIAERPDGSDIVLAGQKNGVLWALDPDQNGKLLWSVKLGPGGPAGGIHWGMAYDGKRIYVPVNKVGIPFEDPEEPGIHAVDVATGKVVWSWINAADCTGDRAQRIPTCNRNYGLSAAALLVDGAVIQGANDGYLRIFDSIDGRLMFQFDTAREFPGVNGITAKGGAIDNASVIAANGLLLVQSGYGLAGVPGNALLAFRPAR